MLEIAKRELDRTSVGGYICLTGLLSSVSMPAVQGRLLPREMSKPRLRPEVRLLALTKWSSPTRLETRTKESNICASTGVVNPGAK